jgi:glycosyltransferase involved in cell wall biosynthesis
VVCPSAGGNALIARRETATGPVVIVDMNAGIDVGHHRHWYDLLVAQVGPEREVVAIRGGEGAATIECCQGRPVRIEYVPEGESRAGWYRTALVRATTYAPSAIVLTSGDDALLAILLERRTLRRVQTHTRALMFRLSPQPKFLGRLSYLVKVAGIGYLRFTLPDVSFYALELPVGRGSRINRRVGIDSVFDSSGEEQVPAVGREVARTRSNLAHVQGPVFLTIGMLGRGKHVDTLLQAWQLSGPIGGGVLLFAGQADSDTDRLLADSAENIAGVEYRPGRLADDEFSWLLEAADLVCAVYRYSASSGVALRALALGTRVLVGGSRPLESSLRGIPGVTILTSVEPRRLATALREAIAHASPAPANYVRPRNQFPGPLGRGLGSGDSSR